MRVLLSSVLFSIALLSLSCQKGSIKSSPEVTEPSAEMGFRNLNNLEINSASKETLLDVDLDGDNDLLFEVKRDNQDFKLVRQSSFFVAGTYYTSFPLNTSEEIVPMNQSEHIPVDNFNGNVWQKEKTVALLNKTVSETGMAVWSGNWATVGRKYLPFQLLKNSQRFSGWIELTEDKSNDRIILHKAAFSKVSGKTIKAGFDY